MGLVETTSYRVETIYDITDKASKVLEDIDKHAKSAAHSTQTLSDVIGGLGAALLAGGALSLAKHAIIDFNANVETAKISLATMFGSTLGGDWDKAKNNAEAVYSEFQKFSTMTPVTTAQIMDFGRGVATATFIAGGSMKDFIKITEQGVIAQKALGAGEHQMTAAISEMLMGRARRQNGTVQLMLGMMHTEAKEFNKLSGDQRLNAVKKFLDSDTMKAAAKEFGSSWAGVTSTLEDKLQILGGKIGLPLFKLVTKEIASWNEWLEKNHRKVDEMAVKVGNGLADGFRVVKDAVMWIADHADVLISVGKVWAGAKLFGSLAGGLQGSMSGLMSSGPVQQFSGVGGAAKGIGNNLAMATAVGTASYMATTELMKLSGASDMMLKAIDPERHAINSLVNSMTVLDASVADATDRMNGLAGAKGTTQYGAMTGLVADLDTKLNVLRDYASGRDKTTEHLGEAGFTDEEIDKVTTDKSTTGYSFMHPIHVKQDDAMAMIDKLQRQRDSLSSFTGTAGDLTNKRIHEAGGMMTPAEKAQIGMDKEGNVAAKQTNVILMEVVRRMRAGQTGFDITANDIKRLLLGSVKEEDPNAYGKIAGKGDTNITIQSVQVAAKDPDRWISDLDAKAKSKIKAPRGPKRQMRGG